jgi:hypothetical protein
MNAAIYFGFFGWPPQLVWRIYFATVRPLKVGEQLYAAPVPMTAADWILIGWSAAIWLIAIFWATRKINLFEVHRSPS